VVGRAACCLSATLGNPRPTRPDPTRDRDRPGFGGCRRRADRRSREGDHRPATTGLNAQRPLKTCALAGRRACPPRECRSGRLRGAGAVGAQAPASPRRKRLSAHPQPTRPSIVRHRQRRTSFLARSLGGGTQRSGVPAAREISRHSVAVPTATCRASQRLRQPPLCLVSRSGWPVPALRRTGAPHRACTRR
jgi:hypothetical protein